MFYKICKSESLQYLFKLVPEKLSSYVARNASNTLLFNTEQNFFLISLFFLQKLLNNKTIIFCQIDLEK